MYLEQCKKFRRYSIDTKIVVSNLGELQDFSNRYKRRNEHKWRVNNWLKIHGKPMRRKPYKKKNVILSLTKYMRDFIETLN